MSFYVRKSLKAGPFRFNASKSGLGVSVGVPGFRVGLIGPRGHYIQAQRGGLCYRKSLNAGRSRSHTRPTHVNPTSPRRPIAAPPSGDVVMHDTTGATVLALAAAEPSELVTQLTQAQQRHRLAPWVVVAAVLLSMLVPVASPVFLLAGLVGFFYAHQLDKARRSVVAFYDVEGELATAYDGLVSAFTALIPAKRSSQIVKRGGITTTRDYKMHSGADSLVNLTKLALRLKGPTVLVTNISVPSFESSHRSVYLLPDRILVREGKSFAEVSYAHCSVAFHPGRFIESGRPPSDAVVVDHTWTYVNKKGGPDHRFKDNPRRHITQMGYLDLVNGAGLRCNWVFSRVEPARGLAHAVEVLVAARVRTPNATAA
jgi:DNA polymerase III subunit epsilon